MSAREGDCPEGCQEHRTCRSQVSEEYAPGLWRPAVPLPLYLPFHVRCKCGKRFWGLRIQVQRGAASERYERHYRAEHIDPGRHAWLPKDRGGWP